MKLTVKGRSYTQPIVVKQDPRVKTPASTMERIYSLTEAVYTSAVDAQKAAEEAQQAAEALATELNASASALTAVMNSLQAADATPTALQVKNMETALSNARGALAKWRALRGATAHPRSAPAGRSGRGGRGRR